MILSSLAWCLSIWLSEFKPLPGFHLPFLFPEEPIDFVVGLLLGVAVLLLDQAFQLVALTRDFVEIVVGQLAPHFPHAAAQLLPLAFQDVFIIFKENTICTCTSAAGRSDAAAPPTMCRRGSAPGHRRTVRRRSTAGLTN